MSTKTTIKRIALVAVSALGLGVVTAIAPASATANVTPTAVAVGTVPTHRIGVFAETPITITHPDPAAATDTFTVSVKVTAAPSTSKLFGHSADTFNAAGARLIWSVPAGSGLTMTDGTYTANTNAATGGYDAQASAVFTVSSASALKTTVGLKFKADVAGTYSFLISAGGLAGTFYVAGQPTAAMSLTTGGAPASATLTAINSSSIEGYNAAIKVALKDASGNATVLGVDESLLLTEDCTATITDKTDGDTTIDSSDFVGGYGWINLAQAADSISSTATCVATVTGSGALASSLTSNVTVSFYNDAVTEGVVTIYDSTVGYKAETVTGTNGDTEYSTSLASHTFAVAASAGTSTTATTYGAFLFEDTDGVKTGYGSSWTLGYAVAYAAATTAATTANITVGIDLANDVDLSFTVGTPTDTDDITIAGGVPTKTSVTADDVTIRAAKGATVTLYATITDQYGVEMANQSATVAVTGRNATTSTITKSSDADGRISYAITDAGTTGDSTVTFTATGTDSVTIIWSEAVVSTVTVTGGATADTVAYPAAGSTTKAISTAVAGAGAATTTFTATVKDASGNLLTGVPVTWTVDKATAGITKSTTADSSKCYTSSDGTCTTTVYSWAAPSKVTVTATAGGVSGTGHQNYVNAATDARVLSGTANGNVVTAKVVDRYGNPVSGVTVSAKTSSGYFGSGSTSTTGSTDENGEVGFAVTGGNATVTLKVDSATYTQTDDAEGKVGTTAVTAAVAGTSTGVGASLAPAGVNSVTVDTSAAVATSDAIDAANEATDAANAATDAANAAAEAADAATAAAQDAQAAVAALATEVAAMISGIKAQIIRLTNLVVKIQKKVNA